MSKKPKRGLRLRARWRTMNGYFRFGFLMSGVVLALVTMLAFGTVKISNQPDMPRWQAFWDASPNEIGDAIAGVAGTLAFLWIIVTVMIQGSELRLQRRELAMTRRELMAQRKEFEKTTETLQAQTDLMVAERELRRFEANSREFQKIVELVLEEIRSGSLGHVHWRFDKLVGDVPFASDHIVPFDAEAMSHLDDRDCLHLLNHRLFAAEMNLVPLTKNTVLHDPPPKSQVLLKFSEVLSLLESLSEALPPSDKTRMLLWRIPEIRKTLDALLKGDIWSKV